MSLEQANKATVLVNLPPSFSHVPNGSPDVMTPDPPTLPPNTCTHPTSLCIEIEEIETGAGGVCSDGVFVKFCEWHQSGYHTSLRVVFMVCFLLSAGYREDSVWKGLWILLAPPLLETQIMSSSFYAEPFVLAIDGYSVSSLCEMHSESGWMCFMSEYKSPAICFDWPPFWFIVSRCRHRE